MNKTKRYCLSNIDRPGIYILFDDEQVVYVGKSLMPFGRIGQHIKQKKMIFNSFRILKCSKKKLDYWESYLIFNLYPRYNVRGISGENLDKLRKKTYKTSNNHNRKKARILTTDNNVQISFGSETSCHVEEYARSCGYSSWSDYLEKIEEEKRIFEERRIRIDPTFQDIVRSEIKRERLLNMTKQNEKRELEQR